MTSLDKNTAQPFDDVDDLTRFADESFDTEEIDLFEYSDQEDSLLTGLKSAILTLDWEINDKNLDELAEEVANQKSQHEGDKVALIYLQALEKVGKYLKAEGAYAHPNAIKLLLTLYYNFEKIFSSPDVTGDEITLLLKSDIRKFKVLQFQISSLKDGTPIRSGDDHIGSKETSAVDKKEPSEFLNSIHATILGLEWEVTDEGLEKFNRQADQLREELQDNTAAQILVQGLQALGAYITEERIHAHPDAFTLLHSFYEGLKILALDKDIDSKQRQEILIDKVGRLNNLKEIIAHRNSLELHENPDEEGNRILDLEDTERGPYNDENLETAISEDKDTLADDALEFIPDANQEMLGDEPVGEQGNAEVDEEQKRTYPVGVAMETTVDKYPEEILDPDAIQPVSDTIADDLIEEELEISSKETFFPESDENGENTEEPLEKLANGMEEQLELLFSKDDQEQQELLPETESVEDVFDDLALGFDEEESTSDDTDAVISESIEELPEIGEDLLLVPNDNQEELDEENSPALSLIDEEKEQGEESNVAELDTEHSLDLDNELDSLLDTSSDEEPKVQNDKNHDNISPALADTADKNGFNEELTAAEIEDDSSEDLQDKLDSLFGSSDKDSSVLMEEELDSLFQKEETPDTDAQKSGITAALADAENKDGFNEELTAAELEDNSSGDLQDKLDSLFGSSEEDIEGPLQEKQEVLVAEKEILDTNAQSDDLKTALPDTDEEDGVQETLMVAELEDDSSGDLQNKLDALFIEEESPGTDKQDSEFSKALVDDGDQVTFSEKDQTEAIQNAAIQVTVISSLVTAAEKVATAPEPKNIQQVRTLVATGKQENPSPQQEVLFTLIDSTATLLAQNPEAAAGRSAIVQELIVGFEDSENPVTLVEAVNRYTAWQLDFFTACHGTRKNSPATDEHIISTVEEGFSQLRETMRQEFATLKKELTKE